MGIFKAYIYAQNTDFVHRLPYLYHNYRKFLINSSIFLIKLYNELQTNKSFDKSKSSLNIDLNFAKFTNFK